VHFISTSKDREDDGLLGCIVPVVWYKLTDVSEVLAASLDLRIVLTEVVSASKTSVNFYESIRR
jgi:hypothetical protein